MKSLARIQVGLELVTERQRVGGGEDLIPLLGEEIRAERIEQKPIKRRYAEERSELIAPERALEAQRA